MKIEDIQELWDQDSQIDETELAKESVKSPDIYNKYPNLISKKANLKNLNGNTTQVNLIQKYIKKRPLT